MASASAAERARRLLALLPMLPSGASLRLEEAASAVGATEEELAADLVTLSMCGIPPYSPDSLVSVWLEGDEVVSWADPPGLGGPVRLSADESRALAAALEAAGYAKDDRLLVSLREAAGPVETESEDVRARIVTRGSSVLGVLAAALEAGRVVRLRYLTPATGTVSERDVQPRAISEHAGVWYLDAWCERASGDRTFRVDRIEHASALDRTFERDASGTETAFTPNTFGSGMLPHARIAFDAGEPVEERDWPGATLHTEADGATVLDVPVADESWIARRVAARLGRARVLEPAALQETVARAANTLMKAARSD